MRSLDEHIARFRKMPLDIPPVLHYYYVVRYIETKLYLRSGMFFSDNGERKEKKDRTKRSGGIKRLAETSDSFFNRLRRGFVFIPCSVS